LELPDDHRMIMSAALFLRFHQGGSVSPAEAVEKSYPEFFSLIK
jgi:5-enolpyruvylshikimate-3-phosphate synthase